MSARVSTEAIPSQSSVDVGFELMGGPQNQLGLMTLLYQFILLWRSMEYLFSLQLLMIVIICHWFTGKIV